MEIIFAFFPAIILPTVAFILIFLFIQKNKRTPEEQGKTPLYTDTCSGRIGMISFRGPFIRLALYEDFLVIAYYKAIVLTYDQLVEVAEKRWGFAKGIKIEHSRPDMPHNIFLFSTSRQKVIDFLHSKMIRTHR